MTFTIDTTDPKRRILDFTHEHISYRPEDSIEVIENKCFSAITTYNEDVGKPLLRMKYFRDYKFSDFISEPKTDESTITRGAAEMTYEQEDTTCPSIFFGRGLWHTELKNTNRVYKLGIDVLDRDWYFGNHYFSAVLNEQKIMVYFKIKDEVTGNVDDYEMHLRLNYWAQLKSEENGNFPYRRVRIRREDSVLNPVVLQPEDHIFICPDKNYDGETSNFHSVNVHLGKLEDPDIKIDDEDARAYQLMLVPYFVIDADESQDLLSLLPGIDLASISISSNSPRVITYTTTSNHGLEIGTEHHIDICGCDPPVYNLSTNEVGTKAVVTADNQLTLTIPDDYELDYSSTFVSGNLKLSRSIHDEFISNLEDVNQPKYQDKVDEYKALITAKYGDMEVFKRDGLKIGDRGKLARWVNEQLSILGLNHSFESDVFDVKSYQGMIEMKSYFHGINPDLFDALGLDKPCGDRVGTEAATEACICDCGTPTTCNCSEPCGCFTFGCIIFQEVVDIDSNSQDITPTTNWTDMLSGSSNSFVQSSTGTHSISQSDTSQLLLSGGSPQFTLKMKSKYSALLRIEALNNAMEPIESAFTGQGNFAQYLLEGNALLSIDYDLSSTQQSAKINWVGSEGNKRRNKVPSSVELGNSLPDVAYLSIKIIDARSVFGEWAIAGANMPSEYGRIDGITAFDNIVSEISNYFQFDGLQVKFSVVAKFGIEIDICKIFRIKLGSLSGFEWNSSSPTNIDTQFGFFASAGVEIEGLFAAEAEVQQLVKYSLRLSEFLPDMGAMLVDLLCGWFEELGVGEYSASMKRRLNIIRKENTTKIATGVQLTIPHLGTAGTQNESSSLYPPSGSAVVEQSEHKSGFFFGRNEYCFDVAREVKKHHTQGLLSTLYSIGALVRNDGDIHEVVEKKAWNKNLQKTFIYALATILDTSLTASTLAQSDTDSSPHPFHTLFHDNLPDGSVSSFFTNNYALFLSGIAVAKVPEVSKSIEGIVEKFKKVKKIRKKLKKMLDFKFTKVAKSVKKSVKKPKNGTLDWYLRAGVQWNYTNLGISPNDFDTKLAMHYLQDGGSEYSFVANNQLKSISDIIRDFKSQSAPDDYCLGHQLIVNFGVKAGWELDLPFAPIPPVPCIRVRPLFNIQVELDVRLNIYEIVESLTNLLTGTTPTRSNTENLISAAIDAVYPSSP